MLLPRWAYVIGLGVNEKVQNTGEPMPNFFLGVDFIVFLAFFFQILSPPPPPHSPHKGSAVFSEHSVVTDLHCNCCAPPHMETLPKLQEEDKKRQNNS